MKQISSRHHIIAMDDSSVYKIFTDGESIFSALSLYCMLGQRPQLIHSVLPESTRRANILQYLKVHHNSLSVDEAGKCLCDLLSKIHDVLDEFHHAFFSHNDICL